MIGECRLTKPRRTAVYHHLVNFLCVLTYRFGICQHLLLLVVGNNKFWTQDGTYWVANRSISLSLCRKDSWQDRQKNDQNDTLTEGSTYLVLLKYSNSELCNNFSWVSRYSCRKTIVLIITCNDFSGCPQKHCIPLSTIHISNIWGPCPWHERI